MAYTGRPPAAAPLTSGDIPDGSVTAADLTNPLTKDAAAVQTLNRTTSDGDIQVFQKDGTTVGSIGSAGGGLSYAQKFQYIQSNSSDVGLRFGGSNVYPLKSSFGGLNDGGVDLGSASYRFRSAYLSGGVYLGGTGSANYLYDYEEGEWTPAVYFGGTQATLSWYGGRYTKIGRLIYINGTCSISSKNGTGSMTIRNLPFTSGSGNESRSNNGRFSEYNTTSYAFFNQVEAGTTYMYVQGASDSNIGVGRHYDFSMIYHPA